jgi:hypothetical protein
VALLLFTQGLALSTSGVNPDLVPVPAALLQGSLLLGGVTQAVLGVDGTTGAQVCPSHRNSPTASHHCSHCVSLTVSPSPSLPRYLPLCVSITIPPTVSHHLSHRHPPQVAVHPALIAGWVALTTTALNLLPVGRLDGGRMVQAAYGRRTLSLSGILSYFGLGLGLLGGNLSLPFGLYLLVTQRSPERSPRDDVSGKETETNAPLS